MKPLNGRLIANQNSASAVSAVDSGVELAALVHEPHDRLGEHEHRRPGRDQQQRDLAQADAGGGAQPGVVAAGGQPRELREEHRRHRDAEHPLREHVDPERRVDRPRHLVGHDRADRRVQQQVDVDQPEADRDRQHQHQHLLDALVAAAREPDAEDRVADPAQRRQHHQQLHERAHHDPDRVRVQPVRALEQRRQADQPRDDHDVPHQRRDRRDREVVVDVEDPDREPGQPEQDDDREQHLAEPDRRACRAPA